MISRTMLAAGTIAVAIAGGGLTAAVTAIGDSPTTRDEAQQDARSRFAAFDRSQRPEDVFRSEGGDDANRTAALEIAKTSRRVAVTAQGEAYAFLNTRNEVCFLWRPAVGGVAASDCSAARDGNAPGILMGQNGSLENPTVAGLVPTGTERVTVRRPDGTVIDVPIVDGAYVYHGKSPFTITWTGPEGRTFSNEVQPIDIHDLKPVG